jgi:hypothetical protein
MAFYHRSYIWRFVFFGLPVAVFCLMFWQVSNWDKPIAGPVAVNENELTQVYQTITLILAALGAIPSLALLLRFSDRVQITEEFIRGRRFLTKRTIRWGELIEYESFPNYIHLAPADESVGIYIDYHMTFSKPMELTRMLSRKARESDANRSGHRRKRRLLICELGLVPTMIFIVASGLLLYFLRQRIIVLGIFSGTVLTLVASWVWVTTRRPPDRWKSGGSIYVTLFLLFLILPPIYFIHNLLVKGFKAVGMFGLLYLVGLLAGTGIMTSLLLNRKHG